MTDSQLAEGDLFIPPLRADEALNNPMLALKPRHVHDLTLIATDDASLAEIAWQRAVREQLESTNG